MEISRLDQQTLSITGLEPLLVDLLCKVEAAADPSGSEAAEARLYSSPTNGAEPEFEEEWTELIQPDLQEYFASSMDIVKGDLRGISTPAPESDVVTLRIPVSHLEAWIHALNQARLALAARYNITEKEMNDLPFGGGGELRGLALFQIYFYGMLQEYFLRFMEDAE